MRTTRKALPTVADVDLWEDEPKKFEGPDPGELTTATVAAPAPKTPDDGPRFISAVELAQMPAPAHVVEGLAYEGGVTVLAGESTAGKGFVTLSLASAIVAGTTWMGRRTLRRSVVYLSFEADALQLRLQALEGQGASLEGIHVLRCSEPISPTVTRDGAEIRSRGEELVASRLLDLAARLAREGLPPIGLLVVDTARSAMTGSEDSSENVAPFIRASRRLLAAAPTAATWIIHHAGWQDGEQKRKRERGSSAWRGLVEVTLFLEIDSESDDGSETRLIMRTLKARGSPKGRPLRLLRQRVDLKGFDIHGNPLTSCVVVADPQTAAQREAEAESARAEAEAQLDERAVEIIRKHTVTSQDQLRQYLGCARETVVPLVTRLLQTGRATKAGQRSPFKVTE